MWQTRIVLLAFSVTPYFILLLVPNFPGKNLRAVSAFSTSASTPDFVELHLPTLKRPSAESIDDSSSLLSSVDHHHIRHEFPSLRRKIVKRETGEVQGMFFPSLALMDELDADGAHQWEETEIQPVSYPDEDPKKFDLNMPASQFLAKEIGMHPSDFGPRGARVLKELQRDSNYGGVSIGELLMLMEQEAYEEALKSSLKTDEFEKDFPASKYHYDTYSIARAAYMNASRLLTPSERLTRQTLLSESRIDDHANPEALVDEILSEQDEEDGEEEDVDESENEVGDYDSSEEQHKLADDTYHHHIPVPSAQVESGQAVSYSKSYASSFKNYQQVQIQEEETKKTELPSSTVSAIIADDTSKREQTTVISIPPNNSTPANDYSQNLSLPSSGNMTTKSRKSSTKSSTGLEITAPGKLGTRRSPRKKRLISAILAPKFALKVFFKMLFCDPFKCCVKYLLLPKKLIKIPCCIKLKIICCICLPIG